jgi:hypothetical protein
MTLTFKSDQDVIIYALEKIIELARENRYIFLAQSIWWISSVIGLQQGLIIHIDNLKARTKGSQDRTLVRAPKEPEKSADQGKIVGTIHVDNLEGFIHPDRILRLQDSDGCYIELDTDRPSTSEDDIPDEIIQNCEAFLKQSQKERKTIG